MALIVTTPVRLGKRVWRPWLRDDDRHVDDRDYEREAKKRSKTSLDELTDCGASYDKHGLHAPDWQA